MTTQPTAQTTIKPAGHADRIRQWEMNAITCQLDARGDCCFELCVVPHSDPSLAMIERFGAPGPALHRHAEVTRLLREDGWMVIDRGAALALHAAA